MISTLASEEEIRRVIQAQRADIKLKQKVKNSVKFNSQFQPLPSNVTIDALIETLPSEVFVQDRVKAYSSLLVSVLSLFLCFFLLSTCHSVVWPLAWVIAGSSITGLVCIANDCAHQAFAKSKSVNNLIGFLIMLPLGYSFFSWKACRKYSLHATKVSSRSSVIVDEIWKRAKGHTFWFASIGHWARQLDFNNYNDEDKLQTIIGTSVVLIFNLCFVDFMISHTGVFGVAKFMLIPWLTHHLIMSTTTLIPILLNDEKSRLVHYNYPKWFEFFSNDITVNLPRNISTSIPHYRLRKAYDALKNEKYGPHIQELNVDWELLTSLIEKTVPKEEYDPVALNSFVVSGRDNHIKDGNIHPIIQKHQGLTGLIQSIKGFIQITDFPMVLNITIISSLAFYGMTIKPTLYTVIWAIIYYVLSALGITAGYHRLWAHKAYKTKLPTKVALLLLGAASLQKSALWWVRDHRAHHKYTDTEKDPYNAKKGFLYSHFLWLFIKKEEGWVGMDDLYQDPWLRWQDKHDTILAILTGFVFPALVSSMWGDFTAGFFYAGAIRGFCLLHSTFFVNSLAHYFGDTTFTDEITPRDNFIVAILTLGEGYHNFHHTFPFDYRNGIRYYDFDPTKWLIKVLSLVGQTFDLKTAPENVILKSRFQMKQKQLNKFGENVDWGTPLADLPIISRSIFDSLLKEGFKLVIINRTIYDVSEFILEHPGGTLVIDTYCGKDATKAFTGGVYKHSRAAYNCLEQYRIGSVDSFTFDSSPLD